MQLLVQVAMVIQGSYYGDTGGHYLVGSLFCRMNGCSYGVLQLQSKIWLLVSWLL